MFTLPLILCKIQLKLNSWSALLLRFSRSPRLRPGRPHTAAVDGRAVQVTIVPAVPPVITAQPGSITRSCQAFTLQEASNVNGAWTDIGTATPPNYSVPIPPTGSKFYRVKPVGF